MRVLVTGGCGYIGSILCNLLLKKNINFAVIDNLSNSSKKFLPLNTKFYLGGIENKKVLSYRVSNLAAIHKINDLI